MARRTVAERIAEAEERGRLIGRSQQIQIHLQEGTGLQHDQTRARNEMMRAAADLALANAKLTYALSRIINEKGW